MTFLSAARSASVRLQSKRPSTFFSATDPFSFEIIECANEVAVDLMKANEWQVLTKLHTLTGDGTDTAFPLPSDYDRMLLNGGVYSASWPTWGYTSVGNLNDWRQLIDSEMGIVTPGYYLILGGEIQFQPAPSAEETPRFYYISKNIIQDEDGTTKPQFTKDSDTLLIEERLLTLGIVYKWREMKGVPRPGDQEDYELALSEASARDKGSQIITSGRRLHGNFVHSWPWALG